MKSMHSKKNNYIEKKHFHYRLVCDKKYYHSEFRQYFENPELFFGEPLIKYFKNKPNEVSTVGLVEINGKKLVVKRYNIKNFWHRIKLWFRPSRAMISWENAHLLHHLKIPTFKPIAVLEERFGFLRQKAFFIYEYVDGIMCCDYFENQQTLTPIFKKTLISMAKTFKIMKENHLYHRDCHHSNMIIFKEKILLLDLDHMKKYSLFKRTFQKLHLKDINKFIHYLGSHEEAKDFFRKTLQGTSSSKK